MKNQFSYLYVLNQVPSMTRPAPTISLYLTAYISNSIIDTDVTFSHNHIDSSQILDLSTEWKI